MLDGCADAAWLASKLQAADNMLNKLLNEYLLPIMCTCWFKILKQDRQEQQCNVYWELTGCVLSRCQQRMFMVAEPAEADADVATDRQASHTPHPHSEAMKLDGRARSQDATAVNTYQPQVR